jgi:hypothetical protein
MDIEQRIAKLEETVALIEGLPGFRGLVAARNMAIGGKDTPLEEVQVADNAFIAVESERLKVRHQMAKSVAEIVENAGITIEDLSKYRGINQRTWKDLMLCAETEYDYEKLAAIRQTADDKYRSGISYLATSMKGLFVLREALRCLPMPVFSQEEFNKRKQSDEACERLLEGHNGKCEGWASSFRTAKLFAQEEGYLRA